MIKCEVIENFTLKDFKKLKNIVRKNKDLTGHLYKEDIFECDEEMAKYLTGENSEKKVVVKILEVIPKVEKKLEEKTKKKKTNKKKKDE